MTNQTNQSATSSMKMNIETKTDLISKKIEGLKLLEKEGAIIGNCFLDNEVYHNPECPGVSKSHIDRLDISEAHYKYWLENSEEPNDAMKFGSAAHTAILEPDFFHDRFTHYPDTTEFTGRSKLAIAARDRFDLENANRTILKKDDFEKIGNIIKAIWSHPTAPRFLEGLKEQCFFWKDEETGILCKCKPDVVVEELETITDLKVVTSADPRDFVKAVVNYNYDVQNAFYLDGVTQSTEQATNNQKRIEPKTFNFVVVEKNAPHGILIATLDEEAVEKGREIYRRNLLKLQNCLETNKWPTYAEEVVELSLPSFGLWR